MTLRDVIPAHLEVQRGLRWAALRGERERQYIQCGGGSLTPRDGYIAVYAMAHNWWAYAVWLVADESLLGVLVHAVLTDADETAWPALLDVLLDDADFGDVVAEVVRG